MALRAGAILISLPFDLKEFGLEISDEEICDNERRPITERDGSNYFGEDERSSQRKKMAFAAMYTLSQDLSLKIGRLNVSEYKKLRAQETNSMPASDKGRESVGASAKNALEAFVEFDGTDICNKMTNTLS